VDFVDLGRPGERSIDEMHRAGGQRRPQTEAGIQIDEIHRPADEPTSSMPAVDVRG